MEKEIWKPVVGYEGIYEVSNTGLVRRVYRYGRRWEHLCKPKLTHDGYYETTLIYQYKAKYIRTHRIVAMAFLGVPEDKSLEVNHKDGNKLNNNVDNLEWVTSSENQKHAYRMGLQVASGNAIVGRKPIECLTLGFKTENLHEMQRELHKRGYATSDRLNWLSCLSSRSEGKPFKYLGLTFRMLNKEEKDE